MVTNNNIVGVFKEKIPEFQVEEFQDLDTITIFVFFTVFIEEAIDQKNILVIEKCVRFIDECFLDGDETLRPGICEIALGIYDQSPVQYEAFVHLLNVKTRAYFDLNTRLWTEGNKGSGSP